MKLIDVEGFMLGEKILEVKDAILEMEVRDSDIWICSFPRSGTTWMQETVWMIANNLNYDKANNEILHIRSPFLEMHQVQNWNRIKATFPDSFKGIGTSVDLTDKSSDPRVIKTHLPWHLLPKQMQTGEKKPKIVFVYRDVRDVCVSYYHHLKVFENAFGDFDEYAETFMQGKVLYGPYWEYLSGFEDRPNMLTVRYEDLRKDLKSELSRLGKFLGKRLDGEALDQLADHLSFEAMKKNPAVNQEKLLGSLKPGQGFIRKGIVGGYREVFSLELNAKFNRWIAQNANKN